MRQIIFPGRPRRNLLSTVGIAPHFRHLRTRRIARGIPQAPPLSCFSAFSPIFSLFEKTEFFYALTRLYPQRDFKVYTLCTAKIVPCSHRVDVWRCLINRRWNWHRRVTVHCPSLLLSRIDSFFSRNL